MASEHKESVDEKQHSSPMKTPTKDGQKNSHAHSPSASPGSHKRTPFLVPSPVPTRRTRTTSQSKFAADSPLQNGVCKEFCRNKGHGFIIPDDGGKNLFVHISDIEGEYVLKEGDRVSFRTCPLPMKRSELQAVEVTILEYHGKHEKWFSGTIP